MNSLQDKKNKWIEWKWTHGDKYEKSARINIHTQNTANNDSHQQTSQLAFQQSLLSENDVWSLDEQQIFVNQDKINKREDTYNKMAEREMICQIGMNPFMNSNYLEDVIVQENFLKPISTTTEKEY